MNIQAIETHYKGYRFRSRLEARWAVFFDSAGIRYEYEKEGFVTRHGPYLPDFYLPEIQHGPDRGIWLEVKPLRGDIEDYKVTTDKLTDVCSAAKGCGIIVKGDPLDSIGTDNVYEIEGVANWSAWAIISGAHDDYEGGAGDAPYVFCVCPYCGTVGIEFDGRGQRVCARNDKCQPGDVADNESYYGHIWHGDKGYSHNHPKLLTAAERARKARFEHGERP